MSILINENDGFIQHTATGGETSFTFDYPIFDETHIKVLRTPTGSTTPVELTIATDYTVPAGSVDNQSGGQIDLAAGSFPSGATAGDLFTLLLNPPFARTTDFNQAGDFLAATLNEELDLIAQQFQRLNRDATKAVLLPQDSTLASVEIDEPTGNAGKLVSVDSTATKLEYVTVGSISGTIDTVFTEEAAGDILMYNGSAWTDATTLTGDYTLSGTNTFSGATTFTGDVVFNGQVSFQDDGELTISSGNITPTGTNHRVDTESDAASDDLDTISGGADGDFLTLRAANTARTVVLKDGTGNIETQDGNDVSLDTTEKIVTLQYDSTASKWLVIATPPSSSAGLVLLGSASASNSTSIDIGSGLDLNAAIDGTYDHYILEIVSLVPATNDTSILLRTSTDGGSTFTSSAASYNATVYSNTNGGVIVDDGGNATEIRLSMVGGGGAGVGSASGESANTILDMFNPASATLLTTFGGYTAYVSADGNAARSSFTGRRSAAEDTDAIRILMSSGNITSGTFYLYGVAKS